MTDSVHPHMPIAKKLTRSFFRTSSSARSLSPALSVVLVLPLLAVFAFGFIYPVARLVALSFSGFTLAQYRRLLEVPLYMDVFAGTLFVALVVMLSCLVLGFPVALAMARVKNRTTVLIGACVVIPLWTSVLIRTYAWIVLLQRNGIVNSLMVSTGIFDKPLTMIHTQGAVILAMTHVLLPYMILPIYAVLRTLPADYARAARNLGAGPVRAFLTVTLPLSLPGVFAGCVMCFVLALGFYITPALVGGPGSMMISTLIGQQTTVLMDWPFAAALATVLLIITLALVFLFRKTLSFSRGLHSVA